MSKVSNKESNGSEPAIHRPDLKAPRLSGQVSEQALRESCAMAQYALAAGLRVPAELVGQLERFDSDLTDNSGQVDSKRIIRIHNRLADLVSPATPKTILLLSVEEKREGPLLFLGAVPLIRRLMFVAIVSVIGFVWVSLSEHVDGGGFDLLKNHGYRLLLSELFLFFAASVGASFANLFQAQRYVKDGTFDPKYESSYWVRYVLGLMAGTILALLIPIEGVFASQQNDGSLLHQLSKPMLALLGGFAASAVYQILTRIVAALESLVQGDIRDLAAARRNAQKAKGAEREMRIRMNLSARLIALKQLLGEGPGTVAIHREIEEIQQQLIRGEVEEPTGFEPQQTSSELSDQ